jgi:hypothetical protein
MVQIRIDFKLTGSMYYDADVIRILSDQGIVTIEPNSRTYEQFIGFIPTIDQILGDIERGNIQAKDTKGLHQFIGILKNTIAGYNSNKNKSRPIGAPEGDHYGTFFVLESMNACIILKGTYMLQRPNIPYTHSFS